MAGLVEAYTGQVHKTVVEMGAGLVDAGEGFRKFGAELQSLGQTVDTWGRAWEVQGKKKNGKKENFVLLVKGGKKQPVPHLYQMSHICINLCSTMLKNM